MPETQSAHLPVHFTETGDLRSSAHKLGQTVKKEIELVPAGVTTTLKYFQYRDSTYEDTVKDSAAFCRNQHSSIPELASPASGLIPRILVIQKGELPIEPSVSVATAVTLLKIGDLESTVEDGIHKVNVVNWGDVGSVTHLPGTSKIKSSGDGKLVCLMTVYLKTAVPP